MHCNQKVLKWKLHLYLGKQYEVWFTPIYLAVKFHLHFLISKGKKYQWSYQQTVKAEYSLIWSPFNMGSPHHIV